MIFGLNALNINNVIVYDVWIFQRRTFGLWLTLVVSLGVPTNYLQLCSLGYEIEDN